MIAILGWSQWWGWVWYMQWPVQWPYTGVHYTVLYSGWRGGSPPPPPGTPVCPGVSSWQPLSTTCSFLTLYQMIFIAVTDSVTRDSWLVTYILLQPNINSAIWAGDLISWSDPLLTGLTPLREWETERVTDTAEMADVDVEAVLWVSEWVSDY